MIYFLICLAGMIGGALAVFLLMEQKRRGLEAQKHDQDKKAVRLQDMTKSIDDKQRMLNDEIRRVKSAQADIGSKVIAYDELQEENSVLKRDLLNLHISWKKLHLDCEQQR